MRYRKSITLSCPECGKKFSKYEHHYYADLKIDSNKIHYCSKSCRSLHIGQTFHCECKNCGDTFIKRKFAIENTKNNFCSKSCAATYNNTHKTKGNRRSKLEIWLEERLALLYPNLNILYSDKTTINSELDIYIPSLNLAFELNGIFHYEPIFGESKLEQIQNNDERKFQACLERGIELCIIDTSQQKYVKPSTSQKYLDIITKLVNYKLSKTDCVEVL
jgi:hypothetical protein